MDFTIDAIINAPLDIRELSFAEAEKLTDDVKYFADKNYIELNTNFTDIVNSYTLKGLRLHLPNLKDDVKMINPKLRISYMDCAALKKFIINNKDYFYKSFENWAVINIKKEYEDFLYENERINWFIQICKNSQNSKRITK